MSKVLSLLSMLAIVSPGFSQNSIQSDFFEKVPYVGAFDGSNDWTSGWTEWDPINANYPAPTETKGNGVFTRAGGLHITTDETWSGVLTLDGWVYVDAGATLTIDPGTIIRGTNKSALIVERGGMIMAVGTANNPIVMTSAQGAGLRSNSDWAGLVLCGKAPNNLPGGEGIAEGGIESPYGGADPHDNSGKIKYLRIEFPGYEVATDKEINGLTFCSVGDGTEIDYVQVSYSGDDAYEWFGGTVNARHLVCLATEDDNFDTDNGYMGMVQYGVTARDSSIVDTDAANGFESDNDADGSEFDPKTHAIFSNITSIGPAVSATEPAVLRPKHAEGAAMRIRRNSRLQVWNSIFAGWGRGLRLESNRGFEAARSDSLTVQYCIIAGVRGEYFKTDVSAGVGAVRSWYFFGDRDNDTLPANTDLMLEDPFHYTAQNFQPTAGSPVLNRSCWYEPTGIDDRSRMSADNLVSNYPNPFNGITHLDVEVEQSTPVSVQVFDLTGKMVASLYEGVMQPGRTTLTFNAENLARGMYIGKVVTGKQETVFKMIAR
jgi:hypothetical protein